MIISKTPFRVSFAGGGTDLPAFYERAGWGAVVSSSIDKFVYIALHRYFENKFVLKYSQTEVRELVEEIQHPLIRECLKILDLRDPVEITSFADIPSTGSGLGSSSAFSVGLVNALNAFRGRTSSHDRCASIACQVEIEQLKEPIGKQDQYAAAFGGLNYIRFNADGSVLVDPIILDREARSELDRRLVMFFTGVTRKASGILAEQKQNIQSSSQSFDLLLRMRDQADTLRVALAAGDLDSIGTVMHEGWLMKKQLAAGVSNPQMDEIYHRGLDAGALGGKILGAGGGGFFLFYCEPHRRKKLIEALPDLRHVEFSLERQGTRIIYVGD